LEREDYFMMALGGMLLYESFVMHVEVQKKSIEKETLAKILYSKNNIKIIKRYDACNIFLRLKLKFLIYFKNIILFI